MSVTLTNQVSGFSLLDDSGLAVTVAAAASTTPHTLTVPATRRDNSLIRHITGGDTEFTLSVMEQGGAGESETQVDYLTFASNLTNYIRSTGTGLALTGTSTVTLNISGTSLLTVQVGSITIDVPLKPPTYADATARDAAISAPSAGMVVYNTALTALQVYTTAWETITSA
jgi:hypothetical protein